MTDDNKLAETKSNIKWVTSRQGVFETYANQAHVTWSLDDVSLHFAQMTETEETLGPGSKLETVSVQKASITMSWRGIKILHRLLGQIVSNYENANGEINVTPTLAPNEGT